jgi:tetratricopeptide (TPR) repeat protein
MTIAEANKIIRELECKNNLTEDEEFEYTEALGFMIKTTADPRYMMALGGYYYGLRAFDLALKYYDMAAALDYEEANECLGYVWYYGRTGTKDYEKAFRYFSAAAAKGNLVARYKIADMYKNGYFVDKDYEKYKEIIRELYPVVEDAEYLGDPLPEIFTRLAAIEAEEGNTDKAVDLYFRAKDFLAQRIMYNPFFGNLNIMKWLIEDLYKLIEPDPYEMDLYDLYYWLTFPCTISFELEGKEYTVSCVEEDGQMHIKFEDTWYMDVDNFFKKASVNGKLLTDYYFDIGFLSLEE